MVTELLDYHVITEYLRIYNLEIMGTTDKIAARLNQYFITQGKNGEIQLARCDKCTYYSDAKLDQCPFCGDREGIIGIDANPKPVKLTMLKEDSEPINTTFIEPVDKEPDVIFSESDLNKVIKEIKVCSRMAAEQIYRVGQLIKTIKEFKLWKCRLDERGKHKYSGPYECIEAETGIKRAYAHRLISVVREFTEDELKEYGVTRLSFAVRVPDKDRRKEFLSEAKNTKTEGQGLKKLVHKMNQTPPPKNSDKIEHTQHNPNSTNKRKIANVKNIDIELGIKTVPMWVRPKDHARVNQPTSPAMSITDSPWFIMPIGQDLFMTVKTKTNIKGEIEAIVEFRGGKIE